ncbi:MAG: DUF6265 family protein [Myxococcaceae bacterium]
MTRGVGLLCLALWSTAAAAAAPPPAGIEEMAWLAGQWREQGTSDRIDAFLLPPSNGNMLGVFRRVRGGQVTTYALATVDQVGRSLVLRSRTFDSTLRARQSQEAPSAQNLVSISPGEIRFEKASVTRTREGFELFAGILHVRMSRVPPSTASVVAAPPQDETLAQASPGSKPPPARIGAAAWLEGDWVGQGLRGASEEAWLAPLAGSMGGVYRGTRDGRVTFLELTALMEWGPSLLFRVKHFAPDLRGWEPREKTVDFPLVRFAPGALFLGGMTYLRTPEGLESWVLIGQKDGGVRPEKFLYRPRGR